MAVSTAGINEDRVGHAALSPRPARVRRKAEEFITRDVSKSKMKVP